MNGLLRELKMKSKRAKWLSLGQEDIVLVQSCFSSEELFHNCMLNNFVCLDLVGRATRHGGISSYLDADIHKVDI